MHEEFMLKGGVFFEPTRCANVRLWPVAAMAAVDRCGHEAPAVLSGQQTYSYSVRGQAPAGQRTPGRPPAGLSPVPQLGTFLKHPTALMASSVSCSTLAMVG